MIKTFLYPHPQFKLFQKRQKKNSEEHNVDFGLQMVSEL